MKPSELIALIAALCTIASFLISEEPQEATPDVIVVHEKHAKAYNKFTDHGKYYLITWDKELMEVDRATYLMT